jgi:F-type H+-transporting ATPase subunit b
MLNLDPATIIFQILNFIILAVLLHRFLFDPIMTRAKEHAEKKARLMEELEQDREEMRKVRAELQARLDEAEEEAAEIIAEAQNQAEEERESLLEDAREEAERIIAEAQSTVYQYGRQAIDEFHDEMLEVILDISGLVIGQVAPSDLHESMVRQLNDRIWELGRSEMARVEAFRSALGDRTPTVHVVTALPLSPELQGQLIRTFSALADRNVNLEVEADASLGVGLRVRAGDLVVDNSIAGELDELRESVSKALKEHVADEQQV